MKLNNMKINKELLKKSIKNIRIKQIQDKVNLEAEIEHVRNTIGSPLPLKEQNEYYAQQGRDYLRRKAIKEKSYPVLSLEGLLARFM